MVEKNENFGPQSKTNKHTTPVDGLPGFDSELSDDKLPIETPYEEVKHNSDKFETLVSKSSTVLFRARSVFPFKFFPTVIVVDEKKVNIIHGIFFSSEEIQSILIHHVKDVIADTSLFFGTLKILPDGFNENWVKVKYLWRNDAIRARRIISGLLIGLKEGVDMTKVETTNFEQKIEALGTVN